jgi:hypothetical protein
VNIKKCPCLALVVYSKAPDNLGKVVEVVARHDVFGLAAWDCHSDIPLTCMLGSEKGGYVIEGLFVKMNDVIFLDAHLKQINDPDAPEEEIEDERIIERVAE